MVDIDLVGPEVKVVGNRDDEHSFRLTNPAGEIVIAPDVEYSADFLAYQGTSMFGVDLDLTEVDTGAITLPIKIANGRYRLRRLNPQRTILTIFVEAR